MPPPESHLALDDEEIAILIKWIEQGAEYKQHWSFIMPEKADLPSVDNTFWPKSPIDYFVLNKLEKEGLSPSKKAEKEILIRRLYFNLTGLPPSLEAVEAFTGDDAPDAFVADENLPEALQGRVYYEPSEQGAEARFAERLRAWRERRKAGR